MAHFLLGVGFLFSCLGICFSVYSLYLSLSRKDEDRFLAFEARQNIDSLRKKVQNFEDKMALLEDDGK